MTHSTLERIYPADGGGEIGGHETLELHLQRYHFAGKHLRPGTIADIACGAGYGTHLLATQYGKDIQQIIGIDNTADALQYAKTHYTHPYIEFVLADAMQFRALAPLDTIISLETIEHLAEPAKFVHHLSSQLIKGGRFIASAPVTPSMDANPYHLQDFNPRSFRKLFTDAGLVEIDSLLQVQRYQPFKLFGKKQGRSQHIRKGLLAWYLKHPGKLLLRIRSVFADGFTNKYLLVVFEKK